jgi:hypothetical protein
MFSAARGATIVPPVLLCRRKIGALPIRFPWSHKDYSVSDSARSPDCQSWMGKDLNPSCVKWVARCWAFNAFAEGESGCSIACFGVCFRPLAFHSMSLYASRIHRLLPGIVARVDMIVFQAGQPGASSWTAFTEPTLMSSSAAVALIALRFSWIVAWERWVCCSVCIATCLYQQDWFVHF